MAQLQKYGPYGSQEAEENFSIQLEDDQEIREIIIRHGFIVDAIGFTITDQGTSIYGGKGGNESKIVLKIGEFVTGISGQSGDTNKISKLRVHTNLNKRGYGPFGYKQLTKNVCNFSSPIEKGSNVVGFFGSALDSYLVSLGIYAEKESQSVKNYGPYGHQTGQPWTMMLEPTENLREIIINTGAVVDSITFTTTRNHRKFGGDGGNAEHKIKLKPDEYITNISGSIGKWHQNVDVTKLMIHTNFNQDGYGPYGGGPHTAYLSNFRSQVPSAGRVVGFFGTLHNNYVQSIGLYVKE